MGANFSFEEITGVKFIDHFTILRLPTGEKGLKVSKEEIKKAYRLKALELHPDKQPNNTNAVSDFQQLKASYETLKDEKTRKDFDEDLMIQVKLQGERKLKRTVVPDVTDNSYVNILSSGYEKTYSDGATEFAREEWLKKVRREASVYKDIGSMRNMYSKKLLNTLYYDVSKNGF